MSPAPPIPLFRVHMPETAGAAVSRVLNSGRVSDGDSVTAFEQALAKWVGHPYVVAVSDISAAIQLGLFLAGVRPGDDVLCPAMVCTAATMPISNLWARPVWCDVDPASGLLKAEEIATRATPKSRAVLFYHWSGDVVDVDAIRAAAAARGLKTVEDASDSFGATYRGRPLGQQTADFTALSFRATKHVTTGEGGALICANTADYERARTLRRYGIDPRTFRLPNGDINPASDIPVAGWNMPMTNFQAAIGMEQWPHVERIVRRARENGAFYDSALSGIPGIRLSPRSPSSQSAFWTYSLRADQRTSLIDALTRDGIGAQRLHVRNDTYSCFKDAVRNALPGTDQFDAQTVSIPCGWWVSDDDRERVVQRIRSGWS